MPESFIPVWMSIGEAEEFRRFLQEEARSAEGEIPVREIELLDRALDSEPPRSIDELEAEKPLPEAPRCGGGGESRRELAASIRNLIEGSDLEDGEVLDQVLSVAARVEKEPEAESVDAEEIEGRDFCSCGGPFLCPRCGKSPDAVAASPDTQDSDRGLREALCGLDAIAAARAAMEENGATVSIEDVAVGIRAALAEHFSTREV